MHPEIKDRRDRIAEIVTLRAEREHLLARLDIVRSERDEAVAAWLAWRSRLLTVAVVVGLVCGGLGMLAGAEMVQRVTARQPCEEVAP